MALSDSHVQELGIDPAVKPILKRRKVLYELSKSVPARSQSAGRSLQIPFNRQVSDPCAYTEKEIQDSIKGNSNESNLMSSPPRYKNPRQAEVQFKSWRGSLLIIAQLFKKAWEFWGIKVCSKLVPDQSNSQKTKKTKILSRHKVHWWTSVASRYRSLVQKILVQKNTINIESKQFCILDISTPVFRKFTLTPKFLIDKSFESFSSEKYYNKADKKVRRIAVNQIIDTKKEYISCVAENIGSYAIKILAISHDRCCCRLWVRLRHQGFLLLCMWSTLLILAQQYKAKVHV